MRGIGPKLPGITYYPPGMAREELEAAIAAGGPLADSLTSLYTVVRRDASGRLHAIPYSEVFAPAYAGKFAAAADSLSSRILRIQGDGSYDAAGALEAEFGAIGPALQADLDRLASLEIPVDIYFRQPR